MKAIYRKHYYHLLIFHPIYFHTGGNRLKFESHKTKHQPAVWPLRTQASLGVSQSMETAIRTYHRLRGLLNTNLAVRLENPRPRRVSWCDLLSFGWRYLLSPSVLV